MSSNKNPPWLTRRTLASCWDWSPSSSGRSVERPSSPCWPSFWRPSQEPYFPQSKFSFKAEPWSSGTPSAGSQPLGRSCLPSWRTSGVMPRCSSSEELSRLRLILAREFSSAGAAPFFKCLDILLLHSTALHSRTRLGPLSDPRGRGIRGMATDDGQRLQSWLLQQGHWKLLVLDVSLLLGSELPLQIVLQSSLKNDLALSLTWRISLCL